MKESYPNSKKTLGKGGIAHYEQFLLFPQCFQKACFPGASKGVIVWEWVNSMELFFRKYEMVIVAEIIKDTLRYVFYSLTKNKIIGTGPS